MRTTTVRALGLLLVCSVLLGGCGDGGASREDAPSGSPTSETPSPSEPEPSGPTVEPAAGPVVELGSLTVSYPEGYDPRESEALGAELVAASGPGGEHIALGAYDDIGAETLDDAVDLAITTGSWTRRPRRLDDLEVDGVLMYHLSGPGGAGLTIEQFGAEFGGYDMSLTVAADGPTAERRELIESILATARWK